MGPICCCVSNAVTAAVVSLLVVHWAALISALSISSNKHYTLRHPGTALCPSGSPLHANHQHCLLRERLLEVHRLKTDVRT